MSMIYGSNSTKMISTTYDNRYKVDFDDNSIARLLQSNNIYSRKDIEWYDKFSRFGFGNLDPYDALTTTNEYLFFTKPDLHLFQDRCPDVLNSEIADVPFFRDMLVRYPNVLKQLQKSYSGNPSPFMNLLTNSVNNSMDMASINSDSIETSSTYQGFNIKYRGDSFESDFNQSFSLEFKDTRFLEVYHLFKAYDMYERIKKDGDITPPSDRYLYNRELHDQWCIYKFIVDDDGETILFYSKAWGVFSKNVPREAFGNLSKGEQLTYSIDFQSSLIRDSDPLIISDFNNLVRGYFSSKPVIPIWNKTYDMLDGRWCNIPFIDTSEVRHGDRSTLSPIPRYKLKWR